MKERPILFSGPMVRAILEGRKTQTRRIVKGSPVRVTQFFGRDDKPTHEFGLHLTHDRVINKHVRCPFGQPGGRLWVRETWALDAYTGDMQFCIKYGAGGDNYVTERNGSDEWVPIYRRYMDGCGETDDSWGRWRPSIHMPRWASRLTLEVTGVRVERLQDISEPDAKAEGVEQLARSVGTNYRGAFQHLWDSLNKDRAPWESNPWVWVLSYVKLEAGI